MASKEEACVSCGLEVRVLRGHPWARERMEDSLKPTRPRSAYDDLFPTGGFSMGGYRLYRKSGGTFVTDRAIHYTCAVYGKAPSLLVGSESIRLRPAFRDAIKSFEATGRRLLVQVREGKPSPVREPTDARAAQIRRRGGFGRSVLGRAAARVSAAEGE